jgi:CO dehydrogenase/acetyl-CoA synthase gamma subunit (corrinoid Fe-S protein)
MYNTTITSYPSTEEEVEELIDASIIDKHPYLKESFKHFENLKPMVHKAEDSPQESTVVDHDDEHELAMAEENEKNAMVLWKSKNSGSSLKLQRKLL